MRLVFKLKDDVTPEEWNEISGIVIESVLTQSDLFNVRRGV